jgi:hypothetical protein
VKNPHRKPIILSALLILGFVLSGVATVSSSTGDIGAKPANPDPSNPRSETIFIKQINPGDKSSDAVLVINNTNDQKSIKVYATDSVASSGGAFACAQAAEEPKLVGGWIDVAQNNVKLKPGEKKEIGFEISVPNNASAGEQNGCIVIQEDAQSNFQGGVSVNFRTAIRVAVLVPGDLLRELQAVGLLVASDAGKLILTPSVRNTGSVSLDTTVEPQIKTVFGTKAASQTGQFPVLRDQLTEWNFELDKPFWGGLYRATFTASYDKSELGYIGSTVSPEPATLQGPSKWIITTPHPLALLIEIFALALAIFGIKRLIKQRKHHKHVQTSWRTYQVKPGDQLQKIAHAFSVDWKKLAKVNNLKPPYHLAEDQKLKVPPTTKDNPKPTPTQRKK